MSAYLDHIARLNPKVNAIVALQDRQGLLRQARERDDQISRGEYQGWLHGFPQAIKDLEPTKGIVSTQGSPIFKDFVPQADAIVVERMRRAGCIIIGKTNTPEFGLGSLPPIIFPGRPEGRRSDEALKAEPDAPQATLEQRHQAAGDVLALRRRGFFSAGVLVSMASHSPVETAQ
jgi:Amidase